ADPASPRFHNGGAGHRPVLARGVRHPAEVLDWLPRHHRAALRLPAARPTPGRYGNILNFEVNEISHHKLPKRINPSDSRAQTWRQRSAGCPQHLGTKVFV